MTSSPAKYTISNLEEKDEDSIHRAIVNKNNISFKELVNESNCNSVMNSDLGVLIIQTNNTDMLKYLLEKGAIINNFGKTSGQTALSSAILLNKDDLANILIDNFCGIDTKNRDGLLPLRIATILKKSIANNISSAIQKKADADKTLFEKLKKNDTLRTTPLKKPAKNSLPAIPE